MHTLIITAHSSSKGFTHRIATSFAKGLESNNKTFEILDLYKTDLKQDFLRFENIRELPEDENQIAIQNKISLADEVVFVHPIWWGGMPAILKNFVDQNITPGFGYKYQKDQNGKTQTVKLLSGKSARVFMTCDNVMWQYIMIGVPFVSIWFFFILDFCGLDVKSITVFDKMRKRSEGELNNLEQKVESISKNNSRPFNPILILFKIMSKSKDILGL